MLFDKRGTGLSHRVPESEPPTLDTRMEDVLTVCGAAGSDNAALLGICEGGPMCGLFAATYPDRTTAIIQFGSYARRLQDADYAWGSSPEEYEAFIEGMARGWGGPIGLKGSRAEQGR